MRKGIYLDSAATTRVKKEVVKEMEKYFINDYGNPSSIHELGERARKAMNTARTILANEINAKPHEIIFTSGGTEANNLALQGLARAYTNKKKILISAIEHPSVFEVCNFLNSLKYKVVKIPVDSEGILRFDVLKNEIEKDAKNILLVSIMYVNNVVGVIQNIEDIGKLCHENNVLFHTDAVQSFGKLFIDAKKMNIDLLSASGHKIGGPKGIGFLYVQDGIKLKPLIFGGGQERDLRSGTENVSGAVGFAKALEIFKKIDKNKIIKIRDKLIYELEKFGGKINGSKEKRIYDNVHVSFSGVNTESLVLFLSQKGIYVSAGSACDSNKERDDRVLGAIGIEDKDRNGAIRLSLSEDVSVSDAEYVINKIQKVVRTLRVKHGKRKVYKRCIINDIIKRKEVKDG